MHTRMMFAVLLALLAAPMFAQIEVGDDVAEFTPRHWVNTPTFQSFEELKGDVIFIKSWGIN